MTSVMSLRKILHFQLRKLYEKGLRIEVKYL